MRARDTAGYRYLTCALLAGKKFPLEQANEAVAAAQRPGRSSEGKFFLEG